jgi:hypothetical protein
MAIVYFNQATALALEAITGKLPPSTPWVLRLFSNNHTPAVGDTEANYTEVAGGGYAAVSVTPASWTVAVDDPSSVTYPTQTIVFTGTTTAPGTIYGYYVTDAAGKALFAERLDADLVPFTPTTNGDSLAVGMSINNGPLAIILANKFIVQGTADAMLSAAQFLGALATGILKVTTATGVLSVATAPDFPTLNQNTSGTASNLSGTPALPNGTTATTQAASDNSTKLATTAYADATVGTGQLFRVTQRLTNADLLSMSTTTPVTIVPAALSGHITVPILATYQAHLVVGYTNARTLNLRYAGTTTTLFGVQALNTSAQNRLYLLGNAAVLEDYATNDPRAKAIEAILNAAAVVGDSANYIDVTVLYWDMLSSI